ncbi:hypothetical protein TNIN_252451 [Trichonephila inaurata madagascariensis]|uniref:Uncharacterized protein n=1 Tax=Trichonephila inaurata madagascariensis TaxID=2747483 RepID=A0A8X6XK91_9ARAC|nr:hypothetical protein TNIN_252451 [Trichonephila inaurata madagascariensis]
MLAVINQRFSASLRYEKDIMKYKEFAPVYSPSPLQSAFDFCIDSEGTQLEIAKNIVTCLCDFEIFKYSLTTEEILEEETDELSKCDQSVQYENKSCDDNVFKIDSSVNSINNKYEQKIIVSFNDIKSVITPFKGERHENVLHWIENFEAQSELLSLSEVHKFIYAKRCLRGNASLIVRSETGINS